MRPWGKIGLDTIFMEAKINTFEGMGLCIIFLFSVIISRSNYLLFHSSLEIFSVFVSFIIFGISIYAYCYLKSNPFIYLGIAYGFIGIFDLLHTFSYEGMGIFETDSANLATQLWIVARYLESISLFISSILYKKKINIFLSFISYLIISIFVGILIFKFDKFPICYVDGEGLSNFKIISEYIITLIILSTILVLVRKKNLFERNIFMLIISSLVFAVLSEIMFIFHIDVYGILDMVGHIFKLISFYFIYKITLRISLKVLLDNLPYKYGKSNEELKSLTKELAEKNKQLDSEVILSKKIEAINKLQELRYRELFNHMRSGVAIYEPIDMGKDFIFKDYNKSAELIDKMKKEDLVGKRLKDCFPKAEEFGLYDILSNVYKTGIPQFMPCSLYKDYRIIGWREYYVYKLPTGEVVSIYDDVTEVKKTYDALMKSEARYRTLIGFLPIALFIHDENEVLFCNDAAAKLIGVPNPEELIGINIATTLQEEERKSYLELYWQVKNNYIDYNSMMESSWTLGNTKLEIESCGDNIIYQGKEAIITLARDISQRKRIEKLEQNAIEKERLLKETLEYDRLRTEFFANISHELRTPLNVILSSIQMFELYHSRDFEDNLTKNKIKYIGVMKQNCYRLLRLVNNLIDITKIDANFFEIELHNENIVSIVENITMSVSDYIKEKGINLLFDTEVEEKIIACNPDSIERIILNLLSNSIKFTESGGEIFVDIKDQKEKIIISVKDTGIGIPENKLDAIFDRFTQVDKSLTRNHEGSGIGLSLVKSLVEKHDGKIFVKSEYRVGTQFIIELPVKVLNEDSDIVFCKKNNRSDSVERIYIEFSDIYK